MSGNTQRSIAKKLGVSQSYVSKILNGKRKPKDMKKFLKEFSALLGDGFSNN